MSVYHERLWYNLLISRYGQHGPTNSAINWSRFSGVGYGTLSHSRHCVQRQEMKVGHEIIASNMWPIVLTLIHLQGHFSYCCLKITVAYFFGL